MILINLSDEETANLKKAMPSGGVPFCHVKHSRLREIGMIEPVLEDGQEYTGGVDECNWTVSFLGSIALDFERENNLRVIYEAR